MMRPCLIFAHVLHLHQNVHTSHHICKISQTEGQNVLHGLRHICKVADEILAEMPGQLCFKWTFDSRPRYYFASSSKFASTSNGPLRTELIFCPFSLGSPNHLLANKLEKYLNRNTARILVEIKDTKNIWNPISESTCTRILKEYLESIL